MDRSRIKNSVESSLEILNRLKNYIKLPEEKGSEIESVIGPSEFEEFSRCDRMEAKLHKTFHGKTMQLTPAVNTP